MARQFGDYEKKMWGLWVTAEISSSIPKALTDSTYAANMILKNWDRYANIALPLGIPPWVVGVIHCRESSFNFKCHLYNGDPLGARTVQAPPERPTVAEGNPPFTWEQSATSALKFRGLDQVKLPDFVAWLLRIEAYNGLGYRMKGENSPYLFNLTNHGQAGLYTADHTFDPAKFGKTPGAVAVLLILKQKGVKLNEVPPQDETPVA